MASLKLSVLLLVSVLVVLVAETESRRGRWRGRNRQRGVTVSGEEEDGNYEVEAGTQSPNVANARPNGRRGGAGGHGRRGGNRRGGGRGVGPGRRGGNRRGGGRRRGGGAGGRRRRPDGRQPGGGRRAQKRCNRRGRCRGGVTPTVDPAMLLGLSTAMNRFGVNVYRKMLEDNSDNFVFSPFSLASVLSMAMLGAAGRTQLDMQSSLGGVNGTHHLAMMTYTDSLGLGETENTTLSIANAIYLKPGFQINPGFAAQLRNKYRSSVGEFEAEDPEVPINDWVEENTEGEITDLIEPGSISGDTVMMLINAIYFKGLWESPFDVDFTTIRPFNVPGSAPVDVEMMVNTANYKVHHSEVLGAHVLELPYQGGRHAMFILLPEVDTTLEVVSERLTDVNLNATLAVNVVAEERTVKIPKFGLDTKQSMKEILKNLGMTSAFDPSIAKFKRMTPQRTGIYIDDVTHQAVIRVDEEGTVATAASSVGITLTSLPMTMDFIADRPFMFIIRDKSKGINLFMGHYTDPEGENLAL